MLSPFTSLKRLLVSLTLCLIVLPSSAQRQIVSVQGMPAVRFGALAGGDFDGDGDEDVFLTGEFLDGTIHSGLYQFVERLVTPIPNASPKITAVYERLSFPKRDVKGGSVVWRDINGDGRLDILVTGLALEEETTSSKILRPATDIYFNNGGTFIFNANPGLPGVHRSKADAADFNNDGVMDVILGGESSTGPVFGIWYGNGDGTFQPSSQSFEGLILTSLDVADMDANGTNDFIVGGFTASGRPVVRVFRNMGADMFVREEIDFPELYFAGVAFGDIDFDSDPDILLSGGELSPTILRGRTELFRNDGLGNFTGSPSSLTGLFGGGVMFRDMDGDEDLDFVTWGQGDLSDSEDQKLQVFENIDLSFLQISDLRGVLYGAISWFDSDGNGRLDILITGQQEGALVITLYEF